MTASPTTTVADPRTLPAERWRGRRADHVARVDAWLTPHLARRAKGIRHPVEDFLFTYYSHRPAQLRRWHPGHGTVLLDADPAEFGDGYVRTTVGTGSGSRAGVVLDPAPVLAARRESIDWIHRLLVATASRTPHLGCFGLHEWAMVYRLAPERVRHSAWPLRLGPAETDRLVESSRIRCSHFDAYRFFTPPARPLNLLAPTRAGQHDNEQPGCLHAGMDLYKWAYKLSPLVESELVADCFALARDIRTLDMRASPYDLTALGYPPVRIETAEGRHEYVLAQRSFTERAAPLRSRLITQCERLLAASDG